MTVGLRDDRYSDATIMHPEDSVSHPRDRATVCTDNSVLEGLAALRIRDAFPSTAQVASADVRSLAPASPPLRMTSSPYRARVPMPSRTSTTRRRRGTGAAAALRGHREIRGGKD